MPIYLTSADEYAADSAATKTLDLDEIGHILVLAIYDNGGDCKKAAETLERITIALSGCELGPQLKEIYSGAIEALDNIRGFDLIKGF